ncbi:MAG TPA: DegQ family serine endoprotease [Alphaproteobacteria bacterium]|nr:DegQ family serine endoprotease [Alphaproteobacteria bacterium]
MTQPQTLAPLPSRTAQAKSKFRLRSAFAALLVFSFALPTANIALAQRAPDGFADLAEKLLPAVVNISTTQTQRQAERGPQPRGPEIPQFPPGSPFEEFFRDFFDRNRPDSQQQSKKVTSLGSGFIVDASGYVVTNNHVIEDADEITVILHDDTNLKAKLIGRDKNTDLAVLKVESSKPLPFVKFGDSDKSRVGDWVVAIGNPFGLGGTVTAGIISARARDIQSGPYDDYIQTDASINRGNSGGPMFNLAGDVIGINTAIFSPSGGSVGIGFAIPSALAKPVVDQLRTTGKIRRGWLGVRIQQVTEEIAESLGLNKPRGALVAGVTDGGPAEKGGLESGDVVLTFDGKDVNEMRRLPRIVAETPVDKDVPVTVWRKGKEQSVRVKVGELKEDQTASATPSTGESQRGNPQGAVSVLGMGLSDVNGRLREQFRLPNDAKGVVVVDVQGASPAGEKGIRAGDLVLEVAQDKVENANDVKSRIDKAKAAKRKSILLLVERQGDQRFVVLPLG